jgi:hypothetical protein
LAGALQVAVLATLPAIDQQEMCAAELETNRWWSQVHSYPFHSTAKWNYLGSMVPELRLAFYSAGFSQNAHTTMMEHLGGSRPLDNWEPLQQV